jgi:hypothetical protein
MEKKKIDFLEDFRKINKKPKQVKGPKKIKKDQKGSKAAG